MEPKTLDELAALLEVLRAGGADTFESPGGLKLTLRPPAGAPPRPRESTKPETPAERAERLLFRGMRQGAGV